MELVSADEEAVAAFARWFPEGSLAELPDIDADPEAFGIRRFTLQPTGATMDHPLFPVVWPL